MDPQLDNQLRLTRRQLFGLASRASAPRRWRR